MVSRGTRRLYRIQYSTRGSSQAVIDDTRHCDGVLSVGRAGRESWPARFVMVKVKLLGRSFLRSGLCLCLYFGVHLGNGDGIELHRGQDLFQPLEDFITIDVAGSGFGHGHWLGIWLRFFGRDLQREFIAGTVLKDVVILRRRLAIAGASFSAG